MLTSVAMMCACQKKDSAADQQLAQRKVELDAREEALAERKSALDERAKALDAREKALEQREKSLAAKATTGTQTNPTEPQDPADIAAQREMIVRQLSGVAPDRAQIRAQKAEKESKMESAQTLPGQVESQSEKQPANELERDRQKQRIMDAAGMSPTPP